MIRFEGKGNLFYRCCFKNISWEIKKGEKVGLVGSNGAGNPTQFKILIERRANKWNDHQRGNPKIAHLKQEFDCNLNFQ